MLMYSRVNCVWVTRCADWCCSETLRRRDEGGGSGVDDKVIEPNTSVHFLSLHVSSRLWNPLTPTAAIWIQRKHPVPDRVKLSFVIFDVRALWRSAGFINERMKAAYPRTAAFMQGCMQPACFPSVNPALNHIRDELVWFSLVLCVIMSMDDGVLCAAMLPAWFFTKSLSGTRAGSRSKTTISLFTVSELQLSKLTSSVSDLHSHSQKCQVLGACVAVRPNYSASAS